jgi:hypothetical protein
MVEVERRGENLSSFPVYRNHGIVWGFQFIKNRANKNRNYNIILI